MKNTRTMRTDLPVDVWDRLAAEAAEKGIPVGRYLRNLIVARDTKRHGTQSGATTSTYPRNQTVSRNPRGSDQ